MTASIFRGSSAVVFAASCTGLQSLSGRVGRPLVLIDAALDPSEAIDRLNARSHGCARRYPHQFVHLKFESSWSDWGAFDLSSDHPGIRFDAFGIHADDGGIVVPLPDAIPLSEFRAQLRGVLRHLRLHEATIAPPYLEQPGGGLRSYKIHPRYTPRAAGDLRGAELVTDVYTLDPAESYWRLYWCVVAARAAAGEERPARWL